MLAITMETPTMRNGLLMRFSAPLYMSIYSQYLGDTAPGRKTSCRIIEMVSSRKVAFHFQTKEVPICQFTGHFDFDRIHNAIPSIKALDAFL